MENRIRLLEEEITKLRTENTQTIQYAEYLAECMNELICFIESQTSEKFKYINHGDIRHIISKFNHDNLDPENYIHF